MARVPVRVELDAKKVANALALDIEKIRAEVAEGIAQAIEARKATTRQFWAVAAFNDAAAIARGYAAPDGTGTGAT